MWKKKPFTTEQFIEKAKKVHGDLYDYSKVVYKKNDEKVCIICRKHGEFWQIPNSHLQGCGCNKCANEERIRKNSKTLEQFIRDAEKVHGNDYDYSKVEYHNCKQKVTVICKKHGDFLITPDKFLCGEGCPICRYEKMSEKLSLGQKEFLTRMEQINKGNLDFSKTTYKNAYEKVLVICHNKDQKGNEHGEFMATPRRLLDGSCSCPKCNSSSLETFLRKCLKENSITFEEQKKFSWLLNKGSLSIDFYLSDYNIGIECQGAQHFFDISVFGNTFEETYKRDCIKKQLCEEHGITMLYITLKKYKSNAEKLFYENKNTIYVTSPKEIAFEDIKRLLK